MIITLETYLELKEELIGFCIECGEENSMVEPDGRKLICECCGRPAVFGLEELLQMGMLVE